MALDRDVFMVGSGMAMLLTGRKMSALGMFAKGLLGLEEKWRQKHPEVPDTLDARFREAIRFYDATHLDATNRLLHRIGIPMIAVGTVGLLIHRPWRPFWLLSAWGFSAGWALNFAGHGFFEKNSPAFAEDPVAFIAGPIWDLQQMRGVRAKTVDVPPPATKDAALN